VLSCLLKGSAISAGQTLGKGAVDSIETYFFSKLRRIPANLFAQLWRGSGGVRIEFKFKDWQF